MIKSPTQLSILARAVSHWTGSLNSPEGSCGADGDGGGLVLTAGGGENCFRGGGENVGGGRRER